jgi:periplasmic protein CpxP/Spy
MMPNTVQQEAAMAEQQNPANDPQRSTTRWYQGRVRTAALVFLVALSAGAVGGLVTDACGQSPRLWQAVGMIDGPIDPTAIDRHVERMIKHLAVEADATADQQAKLVTIATVAVNDLLPLRAKARANREQTITLFSATTIDREAIERVRSERQALTETASKRIAQALADAADVLTPDQRRSLVDRFSQFEHSWHFWHRG